MQSQTSVVFPASDIAKLTLSGTRHEANPGCVAEAKHDVRRRMAGHRRCRVSTIVDLADAPHSTVSHIGAKLTRAARSRSDDESAHAHRPD